MIIIKSINELKKEVNFKANIGFVPTMGSLHKGHISLIESSKKKNKKTIVSIFVNPTQFNSKNDFKNYPRNIRKDIIKLKRLNVDYVFIPKITEIYKNNASKSFKLSEKDKVLCAKKRKGHFEGVLTIINKLLKIIKANYIFLGEKDFQQVYLIKKLIKNRFKIKIITCPTIRDKFYLAYSSRNILLKKNDIKKARNIIKKVYFFKKLVNLNFNNLNKLKKLKKEIMAICESLDYLEIRNKFDLSKKFNKHNYKIFIAFYINKVRLIDNF